MHLTKLGEILRDADIANAISSIVRSHRMTEEQTKNALLELHVPRAANVAEITHHAFPLCRLLCNYQGKLWTEIAALST